MRSADLLERMRTNPQGDWTIADIERLCRAYGLTITAPRRGSHYKVRDPKSGAILTIPARRPIKAVYIRALVALPIVSVKGRTDNDLSLSDHIAAA